MIGGRRKPQQMNANRANNDGEKQGEERVSMTQDEFRIKHSTLIEHYQHVEYNLENIYAALTDNKSFIEGMEDVEKDTIKRLVKRILPLQKHNQIVVLTVDECAEIERICARRNYWIHECYINLVFNYEGGLRKPEDIRMLESDLREAEQMRDCLFEKKLPYLKKKMQSE